PTPIRPALNVGNPLGMLKVALHRLADAGREAFRRCPAQFALDLAGIDGVTPIVAGAVLHVGELAPIAATVSLGAQLVKQRAHGIDDLDIGLLVPDAHVVGFARTTRRQHEAYRAA